MSQQDQRNRAVGATLINRYYRLLMTNPEQLISMYLPKAQFSHDGKASGQTGLDNIRRALQKTYGNVSSGRVTISGMELNKASDNRANQNQFVVVVSGTMFLGAGATGKDFKHLIEVQEHQRAGSGVFGIWADTFRFTENTIPSPPMGGMKFDWSKDTPPMFAQNTPSEVPPPLQMTPAATTEKEPISPPTAPVEEPPLSASEITGKAEPEAEPVKEVAPAPKEEAPVEKKEAPKKEEKEEKPAAPAAAPASFAEMLRLRQAGGAAAASKPATVVAAPAKKEEPKKEAPKKEEKAKEEKPKEEKKTEKKEKKEGEKETEKKADKNRVVFYDAFINNLPPGTTEKDIRAKLDGQVKVAQLNIQTKPSKADPKVIRTFAFIQFDRSVKDIPAALAKIKASKHMIKGQEMKIDVVQEKFDKNGKKEGKSSEKK